MTESTKQRETTAAKQSLQVRHTLDLTIRGLTMCCVPRLTVPSRSVAHISTDPIPSQTFAWGVAWRGVLFCLFVCVCFVCVLCVVLLFTSFFCVVRFKVYSERDDGRTIRIHTTTGTRRQTNNTNETKQNKTKQQHHRHKYSTNETPDSPHIGSCHMQLTSTHPHAQLSARAILDVMCGSPVVVVVVVVTLDLLYFF